MRGAAISEKDGMKVREIFAVHTKERRCFSVSGAGQSTTAATLDLVGAHPCAENVNPKNSISVQSLTP